MLRVVNEAYAECLYAECHYAECRYADYCGALFTAAANFFIELS